MTDWRTPLAQALVEVCRGEGIFQYEESLVVSFLELLAKRDLARPAGKRSGFATILEYKDSGVSRFLSQVRGLWSQTFPKPMSLQAPSPPTSVHRYDAVLALKLDKEYDVTGLQAVLKDYLINNIESPFDCLVIQVCHVFGFWYDVHLRYSCNLLDAYKLVTVIPWVKDGVVRPFSDFGKRTLSLPEN